MAMTGQKAEALKQAIEIAKAAAGSGAQGCISGSNLACIIEDTYNKIVEILDKE